jgi:hypothetical protein
MEAERPVQRLIDRQFGTRFMAMIHAAYLPKKTVGTRVSAL